jgi:hypothetical protein
MFPSEYVKIFDSGKISDIHDIYLDKHPRDDFTKAKYITAISKHNVKYTQNLFTSQGMHGKSERITLSRNCDSYQNFRVHGLSDINELFNTIHSVLCKSYMYEKRMIHTIIEYLLCDQHNVYVQFGGSFYAKIGSSQIEFTPYAAPFPSCDLYIQANCDCNLVVDVDCVFFNWKLRNIIQKDINRGFAIRITEDTVLQNSCVCRITPEMAANNLEIHKENHDSDGFYD